MPGMVFIASAIKQLHDVKSIFRLKGLRYFILLQAEGRSLIFRHHLSAADPAHVSPAIGDTGIIRMPFRQLAEILAPEYPVAAGYQFSLRVLLLRVVNLGLTNDLSYFNFSRKVRQRVLRNSCEESFYLSGRHSNVRRDGPFHFAYHHLFLDLIAKFQADLLHALAIDRFKLLRRITGLREDHVDTALRVGIDFFVEYYDGVDFRFGHHQFVADEQRQKLTPCFLALTTTVGEIIEVSTVELRLEHNVVIYFCYDFVDNI